MMRVLDLFSGIGGFSLGLERTGGFQTVAFCEIDSFCRRVLAKHWPNVPIHDDVRNLRGEDVGPVDAICGGYPCQPDSLAGKRRGAADDRYLWPEMRRLVDELRPSWVIGENVAGHITMGLDGVLSDLESLGYAARPFVVPAVALDAWHRRDRVWIVANSNSIGGRAQSLSQSERCNTSEPRHDGAEGTVANANCRQRSRGRLPGGMGRLGREEDDAQVSLGGGVEWPVEPAVGRVADGIPHRLDRIASLGNALLPQIPEAIGRAILTAESHAEERDGAERNRVANT